MTKRQEALTKVSNEKLISLLLSAEQKLNNEYSENNEIYFNEVTTEILNRMR